MQVPMPTSSSRSLAHKMTQVRKQGRPRLTHVCPSVGLTSVQGNSDRKEVPFFLKYLLCVSFLLCSSGRGVPCPKCTPVTAGKSGSSQPPMSSTQWAPLLLSMRCPGCPGVTLKPLHSNSEKGVCRAGPGSSCCPLQ